MPRHKRKSTDTSPKINKRQSIIHFFANQTNINSSQSKDYQQLTTSSGCDEAHAIELSSDEEKEEMLSSKTLKLNNVRNVLSDDEDNRSRYFDLTSNVNENFPIPDYFKSPTKALRSPSKSPVRSLRTKISGSENFKSPPKKLKTPSKSPSRSPGSSPLHKFPLRNRLGIKMGRIRLRNKSQNMQTGFSSPAKNSQSSVKSPVVSPSKSPGKSPSSSKSPGKSPSKYSVPYYQQNFLHVLSTVLASNDKRLLNDEDMQTIDEFYSLSAATQQLYIRLFQRKHKWHQKEKIIYPNIAEDLSEAFEELFLHNYCLDETSVSHLQESLGLLSAPDIKEVGKAMNIQNLGKKDDIMCSIIKLCNQKNVSTMFGMKNAVEKNVRKIVKEKLGKNYKLESKKRDVFIRVMVLYSLSTSAYDDDSSMGGQGQLLQLLLVNMGQLKYTSYNIKRNTEVFRTRDDLIAFQEALILDFDIFNALQKNDFESGEVIYSKARSLLEAVLEDEDINRFVKSLPTFLRAFTAGSVLVRVLNHSVEVFQKLKKYDVAVNILEFLLSQSLYCQHYRGHWWERTALNYHSHLKQFNDAVISITNGINDPLTKVAYRYNLTKRAERMMKSQKSKKIAADLSEILQEPLLEAPTVTIHGRILPKGGWAGSGTGSSFVINGANDASKTLCGVEQLALKHYQENGYPEGVHGEGSTFGTIFALLFWNIIFMDGIDDVFYCHFQSCPLDMYTTGDFYSNRKDIIESKLNDIKTASNETLDQLIEDTWTNHNGEICSRLNWDLFKTVDEVKGLVTTFGGPFLVDIFKRLLQDFSHFASGLPDLVVWNSTTKKFKLVEVKGPGDRLSTKQVLWMDYFMKINAPAEVCYVKATNAKKLKPKEYEEDDA